MSSSANTTQQSSLGYTEAIVWCVLFSLEAFAIIVLNTVTFTVFVSYKPLQRHSSIQLTNLAINDILVGLIPVTGWVYYIGARSKFWTDKISLLPISIVYSSIDIGAGVGSMANHGCIAVERLLATLWPFKYKREKRKINFCLILLPWLCALLIPTLSQAGFHVLKSHIFAFFVWMPFLTLLLFVIVISYYFLLTRMRAIKRDLRQNDADHRHRLRDQRFTITALIVTIASLFTWLPFIIMSTVNLIIYVNYMLEIVNLFKFLHFLNSLVNPIVYWFRIPHFKAAVYGLWFNRCPRHRVEILSASGTSSSDPKPTLTFAETRL